MNFLPYILKQHFDTEPVVIAERFQFYQRTQSSSESVSEFLASVRMLAARCKFGTFLSEALHDRLVCGLTSESIQKTLLAKKNLTLKAALETALGMEYAAKKAREMKDNSGQATGSVHKLNKFSHCSNSGKFSQGSNSGSCSRCGRGNYSGDQCKFKQAM